MKCGRSSGLSGRQVDGEMCVYLYVQSKMEDELGNTPVVSVLINLYLFAL